MIFAVRSPREHELWPKYFLDPTTGRRIELDPEYSEDCWKALMDALNPFSPRAEAEDPA